MRSLLLSSLILLSNCNVIQMIGGETEVPEGFFDGFENLRRGEICSASSDPNSAPFHNGDGTSGDPYIICESHQLHNISNNMSAFYELDADLSAYNQTISPIGSCADQWCNTGTGIVPFTGAFDGHDYTIFGLNISTQDKHGVGLFGNANNAYIQNVDLKSANINVGSTGTAMITHIGGVIGHYSGGSGYVGNLRFDGDINVGVGGFAQKIGGAIGHLASNISTDRLYVSPSSNIRIEIPTNYGVYNVGAVIGQMASSSQLNQSYSGAHISINSLGPVATYSSVQNIGGLVGIVESNATLENSYFTGNINISPQVGGSYIIKQIGGAIGYMNNAYIKSSYANPNINISAGSYEFIGGAVGRMSSAYAYNSFAVFDPSYLTNGSNIGGFTGTYAGGSFNEIISTGSNCAGVIGASNCTGNTAPVTLYNMGHSVYTAGTYPWDFSTIWNSTSGFPNLKNLNY